MNHLLSVAIPVLWSAALLICMTACSGQSLSPPEDLRIGKLSSGAFRDLQWDNPNTSPVSFELEWRFGDVPHWVPLGISAPERTMYNESRIAPWNAATYCYRGRAVLGDAKSDWSDEVCDRMYAGEPHPPPIWPVPAKHVAAEAIQGGVLITWTSYDYDQFGRRLFPWYCGVNQRRVHTPSLVNYLLRPTCPMSPMDRTLGMGSSNSVVPPNHGGLSRKYCYRIVTEFEVRSKSISDDVCPP